MFICFVPVVKSVVALVMSALRKSHFVCLLAALGLIMWRGGRRPLSSEPSRRNSDLQNGVKIEPQTRYKIMEGRHQTTTPKGHSQAPTSVPLPASKINTLSVKVRLPGENDTTAQQVHQRSPDVHVTGHVQRITQKNHEAPSKWPNWAVPFTEIIPTPDKVIPVPDVPGVKVEASGVKDIAFDLEVNNLKHEFTTPGVSNATLLRKVSAPPFSDISSTNRPEIVPMRGKHNRIEKSPRLDNESLASYLNISMEDYNSLLQKVDLLREMELATDGDPLRPLANFRSRCWISRYPSMDPHYYSRNSYYKTAGIAHWGNKDVVGKAVKFISQTRERMERGVYTRLRCMPHLYVLGLCKCGTTDLMVQLTKHEHIAAPISKEPCWWDFYRRVKKGGSTYSQYLDVFDQAAEEIGQRTIVREGRVYHPAITVDGSCTYFPTTGGVRTPQDNQNSSVTSYGIVHSLRLLQPEARMVVLLREPGERMYSDFWMQIRRTREVRNKDQLTKNNMIPDLFHQQVLTFLQMMTDCFNKTSVRACAYDTSLDKLELHFMPRTGLYHIFISDWLTVYPRDQLLILRSEDYFSNRTHTLLQIYKHVGLDPPASSQLGDIQTSKVANKNKQKSAPMLAKTRTLLSEFWRPFNIELSDLLRDTRFTWTDVLQQ